MALRHHTHPGRRLGGLLFGLTLLLAACGSSATPAASPAGAQPAAGSGGAGGQGLQTLRVGVAAQSIDALPVLVSQYVDTYQKQGLKLETQAFGGLGKLTQGAAAGSVDVMVGSSVGTGAAMVKGLPVKLIADSGPTLKFFVLIVRPDVTSLDQLKGQRIGITTKGSMTDWLVQKLAATQHWNFGTDLVGVPVGGLQEQEAALKTKQIAGFIWTFDAGLQMQSAGTGKVLLNFDTIVPDFPFDTMAASDAVLQKDPQAVAKFLKAYAATVELLRQDRTKAVALIAKTLNLSEATAGQVYDYAMPQFTTDGRISDLQLATVKQGITEMHMVGDQPVDTSKWVAKVGS